MSQTNLLTEKKDKRDAGARVCLVCDNRDGDNWGCRATSLALLETLSDTAEIYGTIPYHTVEKLTPVLPIGGSLPTRITRHLAHKGIIQQSSLGRSDTIASLLIDFIRPDPQVSLKIALRHRQSNPVLAEICDLFERSDQIVINGEGSMIFTNPERRDLLFQMFCIELAHHFGKPVHHINAMVSPCPKHGTNSETVRRITPTLEKLQTFFVRDPVSLEYAHSLFPGLKPESVPDALFSWISRHAYLLENSLSAFPELFQGRPEEYKSPLADILAQPYICLAGASRPRDIDPAAWVSFYVQLVTSLRRKTSLPVIVVEACPGDRFLREVAALSKAPLVPVTTNIFAGFNLLAHARVLVGGRYHPSIMAACGGVPSVFLSSNSHKTASLQKMLGYETSTEFDQTIPADQIPDIVNLCDDYINDRSGLSQKIRSCTENMANSYHSALQNLCGTFDKRTAKTS